MRRIQNELEIADRSEHMGRQRILKSNTIKTIPMNRKFCVWTRRLQYCIYIFFISFVCRSAAISHSHIIHQTDTTDRMNMDLICIIFSGFFLFSLLFVSRPFLVYRLQFARIGLFMCMRKRFIIITILTIATIIMTTTKYWNTQPKLVEMYEIRRACISMCLLCFCANSVSFDSSANSYLVHSIRSLCVQLVFVSCALCCTVLFSVHSIHNHCVEFRCYHNALKTHKLCELFVFVLFRIWCVLFHFQYDQHYNSNNIGVSFDLNVCMRKIECVTSPLSTGILCIVVDIS